MFLFCCILKKERKDSLNFIVTASTDIGLTKKTNQDSFVARTFNTKQGKIVMAVLCDGMGGLSKGEIASASVVHAFSKWADIQLPALCENKILDSSIQKDWTNIAIEYNQKIKDYAASYGTNMGTTVTAMLLTENRYYILNIGDTRAYEITNQISLLTKDQTVVAREVEMGNLTWEAAEKDARRSVLLQCIGASDEVYPDMFYGETKQNAVYMICSDGFRHEITANEILEYLNPAVMLDSTSMKQNMNSLIELNKQRQERDNISVISIRTF